MRYNGFAILLLVSLAILSAGCAASTQKPLQDAMDAANVTADRMFPAINSGDFVAFTQNWSSTMVAAMNESSFNNMTGKMAGQYGRYVSRASTPSAAVAGNYNVFVYECKFEKSNLNLQLTMNKTDVWKVEGFFYR